jgi:hypothetical protein
MRRFVLSCVESAEKFGYPVVVYDLGGLGFGKPLEVGNLTFQKKGYYRKITEGRCARADHKPAIIKDCLRSYEEFIIYLDADTVLIDRIDEMVGDYDIGLTVRPEWEVEKVIKKYMHPFIYGGYVNAGVMCFNATEAAYRFVQEWEYKIAELHDDQGPINDMLKEYFPLKSEQIIERKGVKIRTFDTLHYNYCYFKWLKIYKSWGVTENDIKIKWQEAKILHFKGEIRPEYFRIFYPFKFYFIRVMILDHLYKLSKKLKEKSPWYRRFVVFIKSVILESRIK